jgi:hypothetical protein
MATILIAAPAQAGTAQRNTTPQERVDQPIRADTSPGVQSVTRDQGLSTGRIASPLHENGKKHNGVYVMDGNAVGIAEDGGATFYPLPTEAEGALIVTPEVARDLHLQPGEFPVSQFDNLYASAITPEKSDAILARPFQAESAMAATDHYTSFWAPVGGSWSGEIQRWKRWYGTGCGKSGSSRVPWDNVLAYPTFMAKSMVVYAGVPGQFR